MSGHLRVKSPWSQLGILLGLLGAGLILTVLVSGAVLVMTGVGGKPDWTRPDFIRTMKVMQALSSVIIFFLPAFVFGKVVFDRKPLHYLGFRPGVRPAVYILATVCMLFSFPVVSWLGEFNQSLPLPNWMIDLEKDSEKQLMAFLKARNSFDIFINVIIMAFLPALCEEILFRGAMQRTVIHITKNPWTGIIVTAIIFSALHLQFLGFLPRLFLGIALGAIYWYSGSLWTSILAHFVYNGVQVIAAAYMPAYIENNPDLPAYYALISAVGVVALLGMIRAGSDVSYNKVYHQDELNDNNQFPA